MANDAFNYIAKSLLGMFLRLRKQGRIGNIERVTFFSDQIRDLPDGTYAVVVVELRTMNGSDG